VRSPKASPARAGALRAVVVRWNAAPDAARRPTLAFGGSASVLLYARRDKSSYSPHEDMSPAEPGRWQDGVPAVRALENKAAEAMTFKPGESRNPGGRPKDSSKFKGLRAPTRSRRSRFCCRSRPRANRRRRASRRRLRCSIAATASRPKRCNRPSPVLTQQAHRRRVGSYYRGRRRPGRCRSAGRSGRA
jgi:hypothetical protein